MGVEGSEQDEEPGGGGGEVPGQRRELVLEYGWVEYGWVEYGWVEYGWVEYGWVGCGWVGGDRPVVRRAASGWGVG